MSDDMEPPTWPPSVSPAPYTPAPRISLCISASVSLSLSVSCLHSVTLLLCGLGGGRLHLHCPPLAWGGALGPASPYPETHRYSDGLCPFHSAGCQVLGPDFSVRRAFQVVGSLAKGMKVGMSVACGGPGSQDSQSRATQTGHLGTPWWPEALASLLPAVNWEGSCGNWRVI